MEQMAARDGGLPFVVLSPSEWRHLSTLEGTNKEGGEESPSSRPNQQPRNAGLNYSLLRPSVLSASPTIRGRTVWQMPLGSHSGGGGSGIPDGLTDWTDDGKAKDGLGSVKSPEEGSILAGPMVSHGSRVTRRYPDLRRQNAGTFESTSARGCQKSIRGQFYADPPCAYIPPAHQGAAILS